MFVAKGKNQDQTAHVQSGLGFYHLLMTVMRFSYDEAHFKKSVKHSR